MSVRYPPRDFLAYSPCPSCGDRDLHHFITPPDNDDDMPAGENHMQETEREDRVRSWGGEAVLSIRHKTIHYYRADKTTCDIIRRCLHCGARWPER